MHFRKKFPPSVWLLKQEHARPHSVDAAAEVQTVNMLCSVLPTLWQSISQRQGKKWKLQRPKNSTRVSIKLISIKSDCNLLRSTRCSSAQLQLQIMHTPSSGCLMNAASSDASATPRRLHAADFFHFNERVESRLMKGCPTELLTAPLHSPLKFNQQFPVPTKRDISSYAALQMRPNESCTLKKKQILNSNLCEIKLFMRSKLKNGVRHTEIQIISK